MARIQFTDGSASVPGQRDALREQKEAAKKSRKGYVDSAEMAASDSSQDVYSLFGEADPNADLYGPNYGKRGIRFHKADEVNPYADAEDERLGLDDRARKLIVMALVTFGVFMMGVILPTNLFDTSIYPSGCSPAMFVDELKERCAGFLYFLMGGESFYCCFAWEQVVAVLAGAAMALSGGVYQGALKNALASPSTLGVTSGGTIGTILYAMFAYSDFEGTYDEWLVYKETLSDFELVMEYYGSFFCSLAGCCLIVLIIMIIAYIAGRGKISNVSLVIAGQVLTSFVGVVISCIQYYLIYTAENETVYNIVSSAGSTTFEGVYTKWTVPLFAIPLIICMIIVFANSTRLSLLAFNDEEARSMGLSTARTRNLMVGTCTVMTALVISFCGPVGFVGFMVPHIARRITGPQFTYLLPACAFIGAIMVVGTNYVANLGITGFAVGSTGTFTSIIGCLWFLIMALRMRGDRRGDWY